MAKIFSKSIIILLFFSLVLPLSVNAVEIKNPLSSKNFAELLNAIVSFLIKLAAPIAVIMIIIAGFYFVTAAGDPEKIKTAKQIILWTLVGFIVILSAWAFIEVIQTILKKS